MAKRPDDDEMPPDWEDLQAIERAFDPLWRAMRGEEVVCDTCGNKRDAAQIQCPTCVMVRRNVLGKTIH